MPQLTDGTTDPLARRLRFLLANRNILDVELARFLGITQSGLSKAFTRPGALASHLTKIGEFLGVAPKDLLDQRLSDEAVLKRLRTKGGAVAILSEIPINAGLLARLAKDEIGHFGKGRWALLAEKVRAPEGGELVAWAEADGYLVRKFVPQADGSLFLVHPHDPDKIRSMSAAEARSLRVVLAVCDYVGDRKTPA